ncbi:MAG: class I SAM-dependent methyltransferase [Polyangia bacterium]|jgi:2-polyprenyl-3-methyl-5-hydroxy-6-metoxy-1,4-benzoquinol methylase|nr:class I SAM-dependent methyltransferase [Polyangia bacterium]
MSNLEKYRSTNPIQRLLIGRFIRAAVALAGRRPPGPVLDAGAGEGFFASALREARPGDWHLAAIDNSRSALGHLRSSGLGASPLLGDLCALPFGDGRFSLVVATEVLEHLERPDLALEELCRVSRGLVLLSVPHEPFFAGLNFLRGRNLLRLGSDLDHRQHFTRRGFFRFVEGRLRVVEAPRGTFPWTLALCEVRR